MGAAIRKLFYHPSELQQLQTKTLAKRLGKSPRVLVVDDDQSILLLVGEILLGEGCEVDRCACKGEALKLLGGRDYDVGFFDINLGDGSGWDLVGFCKGRSFKPVVVLMSATDKAPSKDELEKNRIMYFLKKPFDIKVLLSAVEEARSLYKTRIEKARGLSPQRR